MDVVSLAHIASLCTLIKSMEGHIGLNKLAEDERRLIYAFSEVALTSGKSIRSEEVKRHPLCEPFTHATFYRSLKSLVEKGIIARSGPRKTGTYSLQLNQLEEIL